MTGNTCAHVGCNNPAKIKFCSRSCANKHNAAARRSQQADQQIDVLSSGLVPGNASTWLVEKFGHSAASAILSEVEGMMVERVNAGESASEVFASFWPEYLRGRYPIDTGISYGISIPEPSFKPPTSTNIEPDTNLVRHHAIPMSGILADFRRQDAITFIDIDRLFRLGPCVLASRLKKGPIMSALSGQRKWSLRCSNAKLKAVIEADLERLLLRYVHDMLLCLDYGVAFGSVVWEQRTAEYIGVESGVGKQTNWWIPGKIQWAHPSTILQILRHEGTNAFAGYVHRRRMMKPQDVVIDPMQALVLTYGGRFGNMWGESIYEAVYDFAYWYEIIMRAFLRFLHRMGTPVTVVYGPNVGTSERPDGTRIDNPKYGLLLAGAAAMSSGLYLPSETDLQTGKRLWEIQYLDTNQKGEHFVQALQLLSTWITRGVLVGDRSFTQDGETGSYGAGQIHNRLTQIDNDFIFKHLLSLLNDYLILRYAMFNVDFNNPPLARLRAEVVDPDEQEVLMKLFATAGNIKLFSGSPLDQVDWAAAFNSINVPVLDDSEFEKLYKQHMDRRKEAQEMFQQPGQPGGPPRPGDNDSSGGNGRQPFQRQSQDEGKQARVSAVEYLAEGGYAPVTIDPAQAIKYLDMDTPVILIDSGGENVQLQHRTKRGDPVEDPEFERKHPRDDTGKFARKKEEGDEEGEEEDGEDDKEDKSQVSWTGKTHIWTDAGGIEHEFREAEIDGHKYYVAEGVTDDEVLTIHNASRRSLERGSELLGYEMKPVPVLIDAGDEGLGSAMKDIFSDDSKSGMVIVDRAYLSDEKKLETVLFHENLHAQPRTMRPWTNVGEGNGGIWPEEGFAGIITLEYAEKYGLPLLIGWPDALSPYVRAAQEHGWSKDKFYTFMRRAHSIDGDSYRRMTELLLRGTGTKYEAYYDSLDEWWNWVDEGGFGRTKINWPLDVYDGWEDGT